MKQVVFLGGLISLDNEKKLIVSHPGWNCKGDIDKRDEEYTRS